VKAKQRIVQFLCTRVEVLGSGITEDCITSSCTGRGKTARHTGEHCVGHPGAAVYSKELLT